MACALKNENTHPLYLSAIKDVIPIKLAKDICIIMPKLKALF